jgi:Nucleotidyltransferase domain
MSSSYCGGMECVPPAIRQLAGCLDGLSWVTDLLVAGSLATGDYVPGVSDLDLVALTAGPVDVARQETLTVLHRELDQGAARGLDLGCQYVDAANLADHGALHPTWTHGALVQRSLSGVTRAELVRYGFAILGRPPADVLPETTDEDVRRAAIAELCGYWAHAARRPLWWLNPVIADLGLTSMARGRHALRTGQLLTKSQAIDQAHAPTWLKDQLRARRQGQTVTSPRARTALIAWRDARRTVANARREAPPRPADLVDPPGERRGSPPVVCLCGSTRFYDEFQQANYELTMRGEIVLSPGFSHAKAQHGDSEGIRDDSAAKVALDELHKRKIDLADYVLVVNSGGYIGTSTRSEIAYATAHGKPVRYLEAPDPNGPEAV